MTIRATEAGSEFDKLLSDLDGIMAKAMPIEDAKGNPEDEDEDDKAPTAKGEDEGEGEGEGFMKSFPVTLADGTETEAYDATEMLKAMHTQAQRQRDDLTSLRTELASASKVMTKQNEMLKSLAGLIGEQATMLKALREQPAGRKSAAAHAAPPAAPAMKPDDVLAKSLAAQATGALSLMDVAEIEARVTGGHPLLPHHLAAIQAA